MGWLPLFFHAKNAMSKLATQDHSIKAQEVGAGRFFLGEGDCGWRKQALFFTGFLYLFNVFVYFVAMGNQHQTRVFLDNIFGTFSKQIPGLWLGFPCKSTLDGPRAQIVADGIGWSMGRKGFFRLHLVFLDFLGFRCPYHPWDWYIYHIFTYMNGWFLYFFMLNVGKYTIHRCYGLYHGWLNQALWRKLLSWSSGFGGGLGGVMLRGVVD